MRRPLPEKSRSHAVTKNRDDGRQSAAETHSRTGRAVACGRDCILFVSRPNPYQAHFGNLSCWPTAGSPLGPGSGTYIVSDCRRRSPDLPARTPVTASLPVPGTESRRPLVGRPRSVRSLDNSSTKIPSALSLRPSCHREPPGGGRQVPTALPGRCSGESGLLLRPHSQSAAFEAPRRSRGAPGTTPEAADLPALVLTCTTRVTSLSGVTPRTPPPSVHPPGCQSFQRVSLSL